jgi:hypothetical protein
MMLEKLGIPGIRIVIADRLEGEPEFPVSPSNSPSFLLSLPVGRRWRR